MYGIKIFCLHVALNCRSPTPKQANDYQAVRNASYCGQINAGLVKTDLVLCLTLSRPDAAP